MHGHGTSGQSSGLAAATLVALVSGVCGALLLSWGRFAAGGALLLVSIIVLRWPHSIWSSSEGEELSRRQRALAIALISGVAVFFRVYQMEPPGVWGDDAINGLLALDVLDGKITSPFQLVPHALSVFHALTNYAIAGAFWLFGPGPVALRLPGILVGILAVPVLYGTVSPLFGGRVAVVAALFFATSPLQLNHDKVLLQVVLGEFFLLLAMCAFIRGITGTRRWLIPLAGVPLALCLYTYHSTKIAPLIAVIFAACAVWRSNASRRTLVLELSGLCAVFLLCSIPAAEGYLHQPHALTGRVNSVALWRAVRASGSVQPVWNAVWRTLMIFHYQQGPEYQWVGIGSDPAFTVVPAFLVVHGAVESLRRWEEPRHSLLLGWVIVGLLPGFLSTEAPRVYRVLLASPPLYVWAALPVVRLYAYAAHAVPRQRWLQGVIALLVVSVSLIDFNYYFYRVYTNREFRWFQGSRLVEMGRTLKELGPGWTGYVIADGFAATYETLDFLARTWGLTFQDVRSLVDVFPIHDDPSGGVLFMVDRSNPAITALVQSMYPMVAADVRTNPPVRSWWFDRWLPLVTANEPAPPIVTFFAVSRRIVDSTRGVIATYFTADGSPIATRVVPNLRFDRAQDLVDGRTRPAKVRWSGAVYAPIDGPYQFSFSSTTDARVWIDDRLVPSHGGGDAASPLAQGLHRIAAEATLTDASTVQLQWQTPGAATGEVPPVLLFRNGDIHGLLAEYDLGKRTLRRVEPYPYYDFFRETFSEPYAVHWRGRLRIPSPGGYQLDVSSNGSASITIGGQALLAGAALPAGDYDFAMHITGVRGAARLQIYWQPGDTAREPIPPTAFSPPLG